MLTILHGADFHLDSAFAGLKPEQAARRRREQRELLEAFAALARERQADLVLLAGDLLDSEHMYRETALALAQTLGSIPCPVFLAPGNHDYYRPGVGYDIIDWPENVHIFRGGLEKMAIPDLQCVVYGRAFTQAHMETSPLEGLRVDEDANWLKLMCVHGDVAEPNSTYGPISFPEIANSGLDYLALGHVHKSSGLQRAGNTWLAYPGCPEGRGFDETGEKGVMVLQAQPGTVTAEFVPLGCHRYEEYTVDISGREPLNAILASLPSDTSRDIYRLELVGTCMAVDVTALERALKDRFYSLTVIDHTKLPQDLWSRREEDSLTGLFLRMMWEICQQEPDNECYQLAARFGLAALENGEDVAL